MTERTRTRLIVLGHVALVALSIGLFRWSRAVKPAAAAVKPAAAQPGPPADAAPDGKIQVALLLDTSSSMNGLIDQARSQLWKIVTRLDSARRAGRRPSIEIALYEYGNSGRGHPESGWIRQIMPLTRDLDRVSEALFALDTNGGDEFPGQVIQAATRELQWSTSRTDLKMIFVAGNEEFTQGPVPPAAAIAAAHARGIQVNVVHCGGDDPTWKEGARLARTDYLSIDQNQVVAHVAAPQDDEIARLGTQLNDTYIAYGAEAKAGVARQAAQDSNAVRAQPGAMLWRSLAKSSKSYKNSTWDLADAVKDGTTSVDKVKAADLPENMQRMTVAERSAFIAGKLAERERISKRIRDLNVEREKFVTAERAKQTGSAAASSLDSAMMKTSKSQARAVGFALD